MNKKIILDDKYTLHPNDWCWATSYERNVYCGDLRIINNKLMYAKYVYPHSGFFWMFITYKVDWHPADNEYNRAVKIAWQTEGLT